MATEHEREWQRDYRQAHYSKVTPGVGNPDRKPIVPANIERREFSEPCFFCGASGACAHRSPR